MKLPTKQFSYIMLIETYYQHDFYMMVGAPIEPDLFVDEIAELIKDHQEEISLQYKKYVLDCKRKNINFTILTSWLKDLFNNDTGHIFFPELYDKCDRVFQIMQHYPETPELEEKITLCTDGVTTETYMKGGLIHREDGPAVVCSNGSSKYYYYGMHIKKPTDNWEEKVEELDQIIQCRFVDDCFYHTLKGKLHKLDGPAVFCIEDPSKNRYFFEGEEYFPPDDTTWSIITAQFNWYTKHGKKTFNNSIL